MRIQVREGGTMSRKLLTNIAVGLMLLVFCLSWRDPLARAQQKPDADSDAQRIEELVTACHIIANEGVVDSFGHMSVRSVKNPNRFYMSRALAPANVTAADIMEFDLSGSPVDPQGRRVNGERFIHSEIYKARPDVQAVIHSHSPVVLPFGIAGVSLKPVIAQAGFLPLETPLFEIREAWGEEAKERGMLVRDSKLAAALAQKLGKSPVVLMRGHGHCVVADSVRRATVQAVYTEMNARVLQSAMQLGKNITYMDAKEIAYNAIENFDIERPWDNLKSRLPDTSKR
jgi:ribulose-5-phosphate 4-epimerase/fuculose-1-phosphate aldolase